MSSSDASNSTRAFKLAWHPRDHVLAVAAMNGEVAVWSIAKNGTGTVTATTLVAAGAGSLAWSPDGRELAIGTFDDQIVIWTLATGATRALSGQSAAHPMDVVLAWSSTGVLASVGSDMTIKTWDTDNGTITHQFDGYEIAREIAWSPDGALLACANYDDAILVWDPVAGSLKSGLDPDAGSTSSIAWAPDGRRLAVAGQALQVWDPHDRASSVIADGLGSPPAVAWSPNGSWLATTEYELTRIWDPASGATINQFPGFFSDGPTIGWSADSNRLAFAGASAPHIWNQESQSLSVLGDT